MKFTIVFTTLLCVSTSWAVQANIEEPKDKREAPVGYGAPGFAAHSYQAPASYAQGDANAISIGAGYSIGGAKPSYSYGGQGSSAGLQLPSEGLSPNGHATIQLAPITLQPGQNFGSGDFSQIMSQLQHSLNAGGLSLQPSNAIAEFHQGGDSLQAINQGQEYSFPQFSSSSSYGAPRYELSQQLTSAPAYSTNTKGLGSYTSTGPVLFNPSNSQQSGAPAAQAISHLSTNTGNAGDISSYSLGAASQPLGGSSYSLGATHSLSGAGQSLGSSPNSLAGLNLGGYSFGGYKQLSGGFSAPGKSSFKPSTYIGSSGQGEDSSHGISGLSGAYASPSFGSYRGGSHGVLSLGSAGHGANLGGSVSSFGSGSSKYLAPYQSTKSEGAEGISSLSSSHFASPPGTTYGHPTSYSNNAHAASSNKPYYVSTKHHRAHYRSPASAHGSLSSYSSGPKYSFTGSSSHYEPSDAHVSASETSYNTIKYSEELKPRVN